MEKGIDFNGLTVAATWDEPLKPGTDIYVHTGDPGLAMNILELFLDAMGKRNLWYESYWLDHHDYQEMRLTSSSEQVWNEWSREHVLSKTQ
ncbi:hypothetical protein [Chitinophaga sp. GbtcB8]|uniref:hypothetical protein n=1 Tax=Chitinophaga sp. GbtcB8 TaxID=2824753 RepID=UPI001C308C08|nr:hypothetical protein [Chitinophaga sp. GbtcB8]